MKISRRQFLTLSAVSAVSVRSSSTSSWGLRDTSGEVVLHEEIIAHRNVPAPFHGFRVGFLSDLHLGICVPHEWIERAVNLLRNASIDLLLIGGDNIWIPDSPLSTMFGELRTKRFHGVPRSELPERVFRDLGQILKGCLPREGAFGVLGNHDTWVAPTICRRVMNEHGILTLVNQVSTIKRDGAALHIIGSDDYWNGVPRLPALPEAPGEFRLLLTHNPDHAAELLARPEHEWKVSPFDLALCGHTHGGQIKLPGIGALNYNILHREFGEGLCSTRSDRGLVYTTRGVGVVELPYRINQPGEATVIELRVV